MTSKERKILTEFPEALDEAVISLFGKSTNCKSHYYFFQDKHVTIFKAKGKKRELIEAFIDGFIAGNQELGNRLINTKK